MWGFTICVVASNAARTVAGIGMSNKMAIGFIEWRQRGNGMINRK